MEVLLVDDQPINSQIHAAAVRKTFGAVRVHTALDLSEALQIASGRRLDLTLLDLGLPKCTGIEALERFRGAFPEVPVLVVSAQDDPAQVQQCYDAGAAGYVSKAAAVVALPEAMKAAVASSSGPDVRR
jgi:DNA-binding NarL/FixJ family response regulator